jgi:hypothetical protein
LNVALKELDELVTYGRNDVVCSLEKQMIQLEKCYHAEVKNLQDEIDNLQSLISSII